MGKLIYKDDINDRASWYFEDAWMSSRGTFSYEWPNDSFPYIVSLHHDVIRNRSVLPAMRQWIENVITDTVITDYEDLSYRKFYGEKYEWDKSYEISNVWMRFHFENEHTAALFRLAFSEFIQEITQHNPKYPEDAEWCNMTPEEKYEKTGYRS